MSSISEPRPPSLSDSIRKAIKVLAMVLIGVTVIMALGGGWFATRVLERELARGAREEAKGGTWEIHEAADDLTREPMRITKIRIYPRKGDPGSAWVSVVSRHHPRHGTDSVILTDAFVESWASWDGPSQNGQTVEVMLEGPWGMRELPSVMTELPGTLRVSGLHERLVAARREGAERVRIVIVRGGERRDAEVPLAGLPVADVGEGHGEGGGERP